MKTRKKFRIGCVQLNAGIFPQKNFTAISRLLKQAVRRHCDLVALPETCFWRGPSREMDAMYRRQLPLFLTHIRRWAAEHETGVLVGSILEPAGRGGRFYNTSLLIGRTGRILARYRKIHLFDIRLSGSLSTQESRRFAPGREVVSGVFDGLRMGMSICYDLRFPELFRRFSAGGCRLAFVPANFTYETGRAHWEVLLQARAIENQMFIAAPAQTGTSPANGIRSFGTSLIVDPWGKILARATRTGEELITADLDLQSQQELRRCFPVLRHRVLRG